jgi:hypothetical protein
MRREALRSLQPTIEEHERQQRGKTKYGLSKPSRHIRLLRRRRHDFVDKTPERTPATIMTASEIQNLVLLHTYVLRDGEDPVRFAQSYISEAKMRLADMDVEIDMVVEPVGQDVISKKPAVKVYTTEDVLRKNKTAGKIISALSMGRG